MQAEKVADRAVARTEMALGFWIDDRLMGGDGVAEIMVEVGEPGEIANAAHVHPVVELPPSISRLAKARREIFEFFQVEPQKIAALSCHVESHFAPVPSTNLPTSYRGSCVSSTRAPNLLYSPEGRARWPAIRRNVLGNRRTRGGIGALADAHRRHQHVSAADEHFILDRRRVLLFAVVVAGDGAGADVGARAHRRVAQIGQVLRLGTWPRVDFLTSTKLPTRAVGRDHRAHTQMRKRADRCTRADLTIGDDTAIAAP